MSNNDFTPTLTFYGNPLIGLLPADTADNLIYASALLKRLDASGEWDHDASMGLFRMLDAMHGAAHHLRLALLEPDSGKDTDTQKPDDDQDRPPSVWIVLSDPEATALDIAADRANQTWDEYAADLIRQGLATAGRETPV